ncbi:hypothetical protein D3C73_940180 [compost metagenome]
MCPLDRHLAELPVVVVHGPEPVDLRQREKQCTDQPAPGHRANRSTRCRAFLPDRSAKRHGRSRNRQPVELATGSPRSRQCRTSRRSGNVLGCGSTAGQDRLASHRTVRASAQRHHQGAVDRLHQPGTIDARPERRARSPGGLPVRGVAGSLPHHRNRQVCRPVVTRRQLG